MDLLDSIDNPKFRGLIESMIELDEAKRGSYKYLIETFCNSNPKGIFLANKYILLINIFFKGNHLVNWRYKC